MHIRAHVSAYVHVCVYTRDFGINTQHIQKVQIRMYELCGQLCGVECDECGDELLTQRHLTQQCITCCTHMCER